MSKAEWELVSKKVEGESWKDEYVTVLITSPIIVMFLGCLAAPFGVTGILEGGELMVKPSRATVCDYGIRFL